MTAVTQLHYFVMENLQNWAKNESESLQLSTCRSPLQKIMHWRLGKLHLIWVLDMVTTISWSYGHEWWQTSSRIIPPYYWWDKKACSKDSLTEAISLQQLPLQWLLPPKKALQAIRSGIPVSHLPFWEHFSFLFCQVSIHCMFHSLYVAFSTWLEKVLEQHDEPDIVCQNPEQVFGYLQQYIGKYEAWWGSAFPLTHDW